MKMATVSSLRPLKSWVSRVQTPNPGNPSKPPFFTLIEPGINSAITRGLFQQVRFLVQFGTDVNERDETRCTPLIHCTMIEDEQWGVGIARMLIEKGARIGLRDKRGLNALHYACINDRLELVKVYLSAVDFDVSQRDQFGNTALHYAASVGNIEMLKLLIELHLKYKVSVDLFNKKNITPLLQAYRFGNTECAKLLISLGSANDQFVDMAECKTAKDWRNERLALIGKTKEDQENKENSQRERSSRSRTLRVRLQKDGCKPPSRPQSSRPAGRKIRGSPSGDEEVQEEDEEEGLLSRARNNERLYRAASVNELRNRPDLVFNINPIQCVVNGTSSHPNVPRSPRLMTSARSDRPGSGQMRIPTSWRCEMKKLYGAFEFQFTKSFVAGVKPLPPEPEPSTDDLSSLRPSSAITSESMSGSVSDIASICSRRSNISRKGSGPVDGKKRKPSVVQPNKKRPPALMTLRTDSDTSSETSGSTRRKAKDSDGSDSTSSSRKNSVKSKSSILSALSKLT